MKKVSLAVLLSLGAIASSAYAQGDQGVTMSTDPAVAADVEARAQNLQSQQESMQNMHMDNSGSHKSMHHKKSHGKSTSSSSSQ
jgi:hypothetical protein